MFFNVALFGSLLLSPVVLAVPAGLSARIARRGESHQSRVNRRLGSGTGAISYSSNYAGAVWVESNATFSTVTGTFTVPTPSGTVGSSASIWVGIDGDTCTNTVLQTGIMLIRAIEKSQPLYTTWYEWYPSPLVYFSTQIEISAGDDIKLTVVALSPNSGTVTIENLTNNQRVSQSLNSSASLCRQNAEWIVQDYQRGNSLVSFADFGTVTFTNAVATGTQHYYPSGATIVEIEQNNKVLTNVTTNGSSVTIQYV